MTELSPDSVLARITTHWSQVSNPVQFIARYARAIHCYFHALIRNPEEAEDATQEFLGRVTAKGFAHLTLQHGRFRDYLAVAVKHTAINHLKRMRRNQGAPLVTEVIDDREDFAAADQEWLRQWQQCILDVAWRRLYHHQRETAGNLFHTVLKMRATHETSTDADLARLISAQIGTALSADAFRKQLSRARRRFGELIVEEVARTLDQPTPERVEDELIATGLMPYLAPFLKADWRQRGLLSDD